MSKNIVDGLRYAYEAYCRGDIQGAVDAIDVDPDILWIEPKEFYAGGTYQGRQGVIDYLTLAYSATEKVQNVPEEILVERKVLLSGSLDPERMSQRRACTIRVVQRET